MCITLAALPMLHVEFDFVVECESAKSVLGRKLIAAYKNKILIFHYMANECLCNLSAFNNHMLLKPTHSTTKHITKIIHSECE